MSRRPSVRPLSFHAVAAVLAVLVLAASAVLAVARPAGACACGIAYGSKVGTERALLSLQDGREEIVLGLDLAAPDETSSSAARRPAVLLPTPSTPTVTPLAEDQATVFSALELATRPVRTPAGDDGDGAVAAAPRSGVSVLSRERIGGYDVTRLRAGDAGELRAWLNRGGYATPAAAEPILADYVRRDWAFVAIRLADPVRGEQSTLSPLRISFASERLVYPLRLSSVSERPVDVQLYVAGEHRVLATGFNTFYAGTVAALDPALPAAVRRVVRGRYLTRLGIASDDPAAIRSDVFFRQGASDRLFRASDDYPFETVQNFALGPLPKDLPGQGDDAPLSDPPGGAAWLLLFPAVALSVFLVFVVLRLRERFIHRA
ncbi:DUF2330 domain-containing protein [Patulibacter sp.]|uniref:DUF2330 domain-containing protein n=1 Tax=Patulibacter sp. TaxID=1912859 RepID=UPI002726A4B7|nr:DUF2330 domain-containing protein [Patulibacter sp.]MDO9407074.1 DUF2330 domain-containing protein [Patulibacter sp.]